MTKRMLIDATHKEETRVAVVSEDNRLEDFDYESAVFKQLKGNIYLVKVTRVEPSLQAAFVDFGGNRHGFLPFPEIHPDYYRIPVEDRQALLEEERRLGEAHAAEAEAKADAEAEENERKEKKERNKKSKKAAEDDAAEDGNGKDVEVVGGADAEVEVEENAVRPAQMKVNVKRRYKIQEVIKRGQVMLIQINKEERGNKGAAVSTYISLPGRYCVLMPNSSRGGGVSRKVSNIKDRKRLKKILSDIDVPEGMSVILRTAGVERSKVEIKRDLDYLLRLWNDIRELTLQSTAPALVHEEGNLIKRAIRDLYKREIEEVLVSGENGHKIAKEFMKTLIPSHARRVKLDKEDSPLFARYNVERQIDETYGTNVRLRSGGYLVINPTEALVSIDINSGKATKGRHIEETALRTNVEAAEEIARQLRLRDLGGLVVIDFIDMEENKNNRIVERKLREAMQGDRARIQISRISAFGLLELSRQRLRPSLVESNFSTCPHCSGNAVVRTVESASVMILRQIEEELLRGKGNNDLVVNVSSDVALYLLNKKRRRLHALEDTHKIGISIEVKHAINNEDYDLEYVTSSGKRIAIQITQSGPSSATVGHDDNRGGKGGNRKNNRNNRRNNRRRRSNNNNNNNAHQKDRNDRNDHNDNNQSDQNNDSQSADQQKGQGNTSDDKKQEQGKPENKRRRRKPSSAKKADVKDENKKSSDAADVADKSNAEKSDTAAPEEKKKPAAKKKAAPRKKAPAKADKADKAEKASATEKADKAEKKEPAPKKKPSAKKENKVVELGAPEAGNSKEIPEKDKKKGWWQNLTK